MNPIRIAVILSSILLTTGCASIVSGQHQSLAVQTQQDGVAIPGATCQLSNDKGVWSVTTPGSTVVHRSYNDLIVRCEKDGSTPGEAMTKSRTQALAFGNVFLGGAIGAGVDVASGAAYEYPNLIAVEMGKQVVLHPGAAAAGMAGMGGMGSQPTP